MVKDRLEELRRLCNYPTNSLRDTIIDIKANKIGLEIDKILNEYTQIREWIKSIRGNIEAMKSLVREMSPTNPNQAKKALTDKMESIRLENMSLCQRVYLQMKDMEIDLPRANDSCIIARVKHMNFYCIREEFLTIWKQHEKFLNEYEERLKRAVQIQARIADAHITEEETEALIANNTTSMFVGNLLENTQRERDRLRELLGRQTELEKIEKSIIEVRDMFIRISALVVDQSPLIDQIEYFAHQATLNTDKGAGKLEKARDMKIKRLKRKTWFLFWLAVVLLVIILILIFVD